MSAAATSATEDEERRCASEAVRRCAAAAREWWLDQAPARGRVEQQRMRLIQDRLVRALLLDALKQHVLPPPPLPSSLQSKEVHPPSSPSRLPLPVSAGLALAAAALRIVARDGIAPTQEEDSDDALLRQVRQRLIANWASTVASTTPEAEARSAAHFERRALGRLWACWRAGAGERRRESMRMVAARGAWHSRELARAATTWMQAWARREERLQSAERAEALRVRRVVVQWVGVAKAQRRVHAMLASGEGRRRTSLLRHGWRLLIRWHAERRARLAAADAKRRTGALRTCWRRWQSRAASTAAAQGLLVNVSRALVCWRFWTSLIRCVLRRRRTQLIRCRAVCFHSRTLATQGWSRWAHDLVGVRTRDAQLKAVADPHHAASGAVRMARGLRYWWRCCMLIGEERAMRAAADAHFAAIGRTLLLQSVRRWSTLRGWRMKVRMASTRYLYFAWRRFVAAALGEHERSAAAAWQSDRAEGMRREWGLAAGIACWRVHARFQRAHRRRSLVAMQGPIKSRLALPLRHGLRRWREWWSEQRVARVAVEDELRSLLANGRKWAEALIL